MRAKFNTKNLEQFEKLVRNLSPDLDRESRHLLDWALGELRFRKPMLVTEHYGDYCYCLCPRCDNTIEKDYMRHCVVCGQRFEWNMRKLKYVNWEELHTRREVKRPKRSKHPKTFTVDLDAADDVDEPPPPKIKIESEEERQKRYEEFFPELFDNSKFFDDFTNL